MVWTFGYVLFTASDNGERYLNTSVGLSASKIMEMN